MGSSFRGSEGKVCLVGDPVGGWWEAWLKVWWEIWWLVVLDKSFWCALAIVNPTEATTYICACTENGAFPKSSLCL
jgi:hypothetical protein